MERPAGAIVPPLPSNARFSILSAFLSAFSYKFFPIIIDEASSRVDFARERDDRCLEMDVSGRSGPN